MPQKNKSITERVVRGVVDGMCLGVFLTGLWYSHAVLYPQKHLPWYRAAFYLTQWQARLHALWCALTVAQQLGARWPGARATARLYSVVLDLTAIVSAVFWGLWLYRPALILAGVEDPADPRREYPLWLCHAHHTMPFAAAALEGLLFPRTLDVRAWTAPAECAAALAVPLAYTAWVLAAHARGLWDLPYGFLRASSPRTLVRTLAVVVLVIVALVLVFRLLRCLVLSLHTRSHNEGHTEKKKKKQQ